MVVEICSNRVVVKDVKVVVGIYSSMVLEEVET